MSKFKDSTGEQWTLTCNVNTLQRVIDDTDVDLTEIIKEDSGVLEKTQNPITLTQIIWSLVQDQAEKANLTPSQFGERMVGDCIVDAQEALMEAIANFFPQSTREALMKMSAAGARYRTAVTGRMDRILEMGAIDKLVDEELKKFDEMAEKLIPGEMSTNSQESSA